MFLDSALQRALRRTAATMAAVLAAGAVAAVAAPAAAAATPGLTLGKTAPSSVLAGGDVAFSLTAGNPAPNPGAVPEYNVGFADPLPAGLTYVAGSVSPSSAGEPTIVTDALTGRQTLVWKNVADLQVGDSLALSFRTHADATVLPVGATFTNTGSAYANTDPRRIPAFDATGAAVPGSFTESAVASAGPTTVSALDITKSEPSPEAELLRGVHDHTTVYTLTVSNTSVAASTGVVVTDYLPAALEFLGCGGVDNSSGPEYPGAPSLSATPLVTPCVAPVSVSTVSNPPPNGTTTYPAGVYTRVQWNLGSLAGGATQTIRYRAAIPLRANTTSFGGTTPTPASLGQASNLDNNTGPSTRETATEASATNIARVSGTYSGPLAPAGSSAVSADTSHTVSIEDVRMRKSASTTQFATSGRVQYTVTIDTSEYTSASGIVVTDVIPNGLCPLGGPGTNYTPGAPSECAGSGPTAPSSPFSSVTPNADGTFTVTFAPLAPMPVNGTVTLSYWAGMRTNYAGGDPTVNGDSFVNQASLTATTTPRPGTGESGPQTVGDTSSATIGTGGITIDKTIGPRSMGGDCGTDGSGYGEPSSFPAAQTQFGKGDIICFKVRVGFDTLTKTRNPVVTDFLPVGTEYVAGSATATTHDSRSPATLTATADSLTWVVGSGGGPRFVDIGAVFEWVFAVRVTDAAPVGNPDILGNAMKLRTEDSAGRGRSYRDEVDFTIVPAAPLRVVKGVQSVDTPATGPNGLNSNVDGSSVREGSVVRFRIDLTNDGSAANETDHSVGGVDLWDVLPDGITCADISNVTPVGSIPVAPVVRCTDPGDPQQPSFALNATRSAIRWTYTLDTTKPLAPQSLDPGASWTFTYDMTIPPKTSAGFVFTNTAAVHQYSGLTNLPVSRPEAVVSFFPQSNIDTSLPADQQDAAPASDTSWVTTPGAVVAKTGTTSITETNNDTATQATIGELVTYRYAVTVPAHTSVFDGALTDALPTGFVIAAPAPTAEFCPVAPTPGANPLPACAAPAALPAGVSLDATSGALTIAGAYDNTTASPQRFLVTLTARVTGAALDVASNAIDRVNTATFTSDDKLGGTPLAPVSATYTINVRQPSPVIVKSNNKPGTVSGGDTVTFTVSVGNRTSATDASARPPLHDAFVVDCVPAGLTFAAYGANPGLAPVAGDGTNGCATGTTRLVWSLGTIAPSVTLTTRTYTATVNLAAVGGDTYTNTAVLTGSTLDDGKASFDAPDNLDERTYSRTATSSVVVGGNTVTKSVDQPQRTIGQTATYTLTVTVPANTNFYDAAVLDTVPAGLSAPALQSSACIDTTTSAACPGFTATALTSVAAPGGATKVGWYVGDLTASTHPRRITIVYTSVVQDVPANIAGKALANTVTSVWNATDGRTPTTAGDVFDRQGSSAVATVTVLEPTLTITKAVSDTTPDPAQQFQYTVTVRNGSGVNVSPAYNTVVTDVVPLGVVVDTVAGGGTLAGADPVRGGGTITWSAASLPGPLTAGASYTLTYLAHLAPSSTLTAAALTNTASIPHYEGLPSGGRTYTGPSTTARVTPQFPRLVTTKAATDGAPAYLGTSYAWTVTVTNSGGSAASAVSATDTLPAGWTYDAGTAQVRIAGGPATQIEPSVSTVGTVQTLTWTGLGTLAPTQALTIVYRATPQPSVVTAPGVGAAVAQTNTANSFGNDPSGASGNASGPYGNHPGSASTHIDSADVRIAKTHTGSPVAGAPFTWSLTVSNAGPDRAVGPFTVADTIQAPATLVSASGTGWSCTVTGQQLSCTLTNANDTLASGTAFPVISVVVSTAADLAGGTVLTNTATVSARTYDPVTGNNTSTDSATSTTSADLAVTKHHTGAVVAGQNATWTVDVVNHGPSVSVGPITVSDGLPAGVAFVSASGAGWSCTQASGTVTCIRNADLAVGAAAPQITIVATIPAGQTAAVVNTAAVTGTTPDPDHTNDSSTDSVVPGTSADLAIAKTHVGAVIAGSPATYQVTVSNLGPSVSRGPITVTDTLPAGTTLVSATGTGWSCTPGAGSVACVRAADLAVGATAPVITVVVAIPSSQTGQVLNTATVTGTTSDPNPGNDTDTDSSLPGTKADLVIDKSHTGTAVAGSDLTWTLDVSNAGPSDSPGDITVTDALPAGVAFVSASGSGWSCSVAAGVLTCTRSATLAAGASAPSITLVVTIDPSFGPAALSNTASVDGPLTDPDPTNNSDTDTVTVVDKAEVRIAKSTTGADPVRAGESTEFTLTVTNDGPSTADTVVVDDTLPVGLTPTTVTASGWSCTVTGRQVECTRGTLLPGSSTITVEAAVGSDVLDGTTLTNTATVSTATPGDDPANNSASSTVHVVAAADLVLAKSHAPAYDTVAAGSDAVFRLDVRNDGPSDAQADITVVDTLPAGLSYVSSTGPWTCVAGPVAPSGQQVTCTLQGGALSAGATAARLSMDVHVDASTDAGDVTNRARVDSPTTDPVPGNNSSADTIRVTQVADLSVVKKHTAAAHIGDDLAFTLTVSNAGPSEARDVVLTDSLPTGLTFESADGPGWTCGAVGAVVTCTLAAPLAPNASAADVTVVATVTAEAYPSVTNTATVEGSTLDPDPSNNTSDDVVTVPPLSGLDIVKSHRGNLQVGSTATYTLAVTNHGPTADPGPITVTDPLPVGLDLVSATGPGWTCTSASRVVTCTLAGPLAALATSSISLVVDVLPAAYPGVTNIASVSTPTEQVPGPQKDSSDPAVVLPLVDLGVVKTLASYDTHSSTATWRITVTNHGPNVSTAPITVTDPLPSGLGFESAGGTGWRCALSGRTVTCTRSGDLAVGASSAFTLTTMVTAARGSTVVNTATVVVTDRVPANNTSHASLVVPSDGGLSPTGADQQVLELALLLLLVGAGLLLLGRRPLRRD